MKLDLKVSDDSYSHAAMERMVIEINALISRLNETGSALAIVHLFRRESIEIDGKKRRMHDFAEIDLGPDPTAGTFKVIVHNPEVVGMAIQVLKENGFINIDTSSKRELKVVKPRLTAQQEDDLETEVKRVTKSSIGKLASIKSDALQRIQAAIKAEYIEPRTAKLATNQLDQLMEQAVKHATVIGLIRRRQLIGGGLTFDGPEEEASYKRINDKIYNEPALAMLQVSAEDGDDE